MTAMFWAESFACWMVRLATRANTSPTATCSRQTSATVSVRAATVPVRMSDRNLLPNRGRVRVSPVGEQRNP